MKNKILKVLSIVLLMMLLCGCENWDDYHNFTCSYTGSLPLKNGGTLTSYSAKKTDSHFFTSYNTGIDSCAGENMDNAGKGCGHIMSSEDNSASNITVYSTVFKYDKGDLKGMGEHFTNSSECPDTIYFKTATNGYKMVDSCNVNKDNCYTMSRSDKESTTDIDLGDMDCTYKFDPISIIIRTTKLSNEMALSRSKRQNASWEYMQNHMFYITKLNSSSTTYNIDDINTAYIPYTTSDGYSEIEVGVSGLFYENDYFADKFEDTKQICPPVSVYTPQTAPNGYYLAYGSCSDIVANSYIEISKCQDSNGGSKCYDKDTKQVISCDEAFKKEEILEEETDDSGNKVPQKNCDFSLNKGDEVFTFIYKLYPKEGYKGVGESADALAKQECKGRIGRLRFDKGSSGVNLDSSVDRYEGTDGYTYIIEESVLSQFCNAYKETTQEANCPAYLDCNCKEEKTCYFGDEAKSSKGTCGVIKSSDGEVIEDAEEYFADLSLEIEGLDISNEHLSCEELLRGNLVKVVRMFMNGIRIAGAIICIVKAMGAIMPAVTSHDADALKKAGKTCAILAIILCVIGLFPTLVRLIGKIGGFDLSCL